MSTGKNKNRLQPTYRRIIAALALIFLVTYFRPGPQASEQRDSEARFIDSLLAEMTLQEKLGQLTQYSGERRDGKVPISQEHLKALRRGEVGSFLNVLGADNTHRLQQIAVEETRLGIPLLFGFDVIHGQRTIFPVPLAEASSWEPELAYRSARIAAVEATANGLHWTFAPMVDIAQDPRWGRIAEGAGEDPYLGSVFAAARVKGFQGNDLRAANTLLACAKHFVAYGAAQGGRDYNTADISERTLHELYLPPFKAAVQSGVATLMSAFNEIGGLPMSANRELLTTLLRDRWGFKGFVVSDWTAVQELMNHGIVGTRAAAGRAALEAGVDMDMVAGIFVNDIPPLVQTEQLSEKAVDAAVRRVLRAKVQLGLFDDPYRYGDVEREKSQILSPEHLQAAREIARKSIVLLKNDNQTLPLPKNLKSVAVIGPLADDQAVCLGPWHGNGQAEDVITILAGIKAAVTTRTRVLYAKGCDVQASDKTGFKQALSRARAADAIILVLGETADMSGEAASRSDIGLPGLQLDLARRIHSLGKPVTVVLLNGRPLAIPWLAENTAAIVEAWFLGVQTGPAVAEVLFGDYNPGGKLPATFQRSVGQVPLPYYLKNTGRPADPDNRWTSKYLDAPITPLYPFGHGLSYTQFEYRKLQIIPAKASAGDTVQVRLEVTNTGPRLGDEVVQLYTRDVVASITRPVKELKAFQRLTLAPRETKAVTFKIPVNLLAFYNADMVPVVEAGKFKIMVGSSATDLRLQGSLTVTGATAIMDESTLYFSTIAVHTIDDRE
ncbi:MAG: glycoside hydrolase family 3 N-terminal domain-containing protein [Candidatus Neomarinimicrobiota bacterium]